MDRLKGSSRSDVAPDAGREATSPLGMGSYSKEKLRKSLTLRARKNER
jgi:hypothetical protein